MARGGGGGGGEVLGKKQIDTPGLASEADTPGAGIRGRYPGLASEAENPGAGIRRLETWFCSVSPWLRVCEMAQ